MRLRSLETRLKADAIKTRADHARTEERTSITPLAPLETAEVVTKARDAGGTSTLELLLQKPGRFWTVRPLRSAEKTVAEIEKRIAALATIPDDELKTRLSALRGTPRDRALPEAFALAAEAAARKLGKRPYTVQLLAGVLLSRGKIVEQYTGEGKTLTAVAHAVLSALEGRGVHIATASNYLAKRDALETAPAYNALGLTVAALTPDGAILINPAGQTISCSRKLAYQADIVYGTTSELAFDHLRDELALDRDACVQRGHATLILDEVDALLIDDARTPFIISGAGEPPDQRTWARVTAAVEEVSEDLIQLDRAAGWALLTDEGHAQVIRALGAPDAADPQLNAMIWNAVRARELFRNGTDYLVENGEVILLHKNGEKTPGRRLVGGLHQAIESREGVEIRAETRATNMLGMRELVGLYQHVSGMTGTAETSEASFESVYGLEVVRVPTRKPLLRIDEPTKLYETIEQKAQAIVAGARAASERGQPVLIGVPDERTAEALSALFAAENIPHACLTAKNEERDAQTISLAGRPGAITIATPKGGRGVHFQLGGSLDARVRELIDRGLDEGAARARAKIEQEHDRARVIREGGLLVLGFSHHDSARRDNQLRGRTARQGEPGRTRFYASLQDDFFKHAELPGWLREKTRAQNGLSGPRITALIDEHLALGERRTQGELVVSIPFDSVIAEHRRRLVEQRGIAFNTEDLFGEVRALAEDQLRALISLPNRKRIDDATLMRLYRALGESIPLIERTSPPPSWRGLDARALEAKVVDQLRYELDRALTGAGEKTVRNFVLQTFNAGFADHLEHLRGEREMLAFTTLPGEDPRIVFAKKAGEAWEVLAGSIRGRIARALLDELPPMSLR